MNYKICLPTAGIGSRLKEITKFINKSLVDVDNKPIISHILGNFPKESKFVVPIGYKGNLVREYLEMVHPDYYFEFVDIFPYEGNNSGLGFTLLSCKKFLQEPFVFIPCDTLLRSKIPNPSTNWIGYSESNDKSQYRTINIKDDKVTSINEKSSNASSDDFVYIGLCGIKDFRCFWDAKKDNKKISLEQGEVFGLKSLIKGGVSAINFEWSDIGNENSLERARNFYKRDDSPIILDKKKEKIWFVDNKVIKFNTDKQFILDRVERASILSDFIPEMLSSGENMYMYRKAEGEVLSKVISINLFKKFLKTSKLFWKKIKLSPTQLKNFNVACDDFYRNKTILRVDEFMRIHNKVDDFLTINGTETPPLKSLFEKVNWDILSNGDPTISHGDFHFENIIYNKKLDKLA